MFNLQKSKVLYKVICLGEMSPIKLNCLLYGNGRNWAVGPGEHRGGEVWLGKCRENWKSSYIINVIIAQCSMYLLRILCSWCFSNMMSADDMIYATGD
jgi:hypothetical protein